MIEVVVCWSAAARQVVEQVVRLPDGAWLGDAVTAADIAHQWPEWQVGCTPGIWGRAADWRAPLRDGDRVELCRPLLVDPKVARRERFQRQGSRTAGLFARRRQGAKAGY